MFCKGLGVRDEGLEPGKKPTNLKDKIIFKQII